MAAPNLVDRSRDMATKQHKWIAGAIEHHGVFRAAAEKAGKSTREYAMEHKNSPGTIGKRARLALTLMKLSHHHGHAPENTKHHEEEKPKVSRKERRYGKKE